jgi:hypothetical protein
MIVAYVSGHGYGHATRTGEVLRMLREADPGLPLAVVSSAPERLFRAAVSGLSAFRPLECDVGVAQANALVIDEEETVRRWRRFAADGQARVESEAAWLRGAGARLVLGDVPPLAFAAAARAGVPSVGLANFSWDWIYRHLGRRHPELAEAAEAAAEDYGRAGRLLELPFAGDLTAFPVRERIGLVARRPRLSRAEARRRLGLPGGILVLISFGGVAFSLDAAGLAGLRDCHFFTLGGGDGAVANVTVFRDGQVASLGIGYPDLVGAADVVVSKPGYGIVSDAIGAGTRLVYTERGDFPEYPILVEGMKAYLPCAHVSNQDLLAGRLGEAIAEVLARPFPPLPPTEGAAAAARRIREMAS